MTAPTKRLSYELHEGRELELMIAGKKPLAMFYERAGRNSDVALIPEADFDPYVKAGRFCKDEFEIEGAVDPRTDRPVKTRYVLYALKEEQWRIPAMIMVKQTMRRTKNRPDEGIDRMIGSLLGYTCEQNDEYISTRF